MYETAKGGTRLKKDAKASGQDTASDRSGCSFFSEEFCAALDGTTLPIYIIDPESFEILYCNKIMSRYLGRCVIGELCHKVIRGMDAPCPGCSAMRLYRDGDYTAKEFRHPSGVWVLLQASPVYWKNREFIKITCLDITKQKQLEAELHLRSREYEILVQQSITGVMRYDIDTDTAAVNVNRNLERVEEYTIQGYSRALRESGLLDAGNMDLAEAILKDIREGRPSQGCDLLLCLDRDGLRWCHIDYVLIRNEEGRVHRAVVSFYDNTEEREKELVYQNWNERLNTLMNEYTLYMRVNLSEDIIETESRTGAWEQDIGGHRFSGAVENAEAEKVFEEDKRGFRRFFNRERLLGQFFAGHQEGSLEYRVQAEGKLLWHKAELQMFKDPDSDDVKASIVVSNVDVDFRERARLKNEAEQDTMTGLYNHATSERLIGRALAQTSGTRCCLLIIDLDDLREINNSFGHPEGDRALEIIADCMTAQFGTDRILGRIGGDEFIVFLQDAPEDAELKRLLSGFLQRVNANAIGPQDVWPVHVSVGGVVGTVGEDDFKTLYHQADLALYYTKAMGKNSFSLYEPGLEKREFSYQCQSAVTLAKLDAFDSSEFRKLLQAVSAYFPMVISVNLTQNTYYMMEYMSYAMQRHKNQGNFDQLVADGARSFHPDDRESFLQSFSRESLLRAHARGERIVRHTGRQLGDDGIYRMTQGVVIFVTDEGTGDICEITFSHTEL